MCRCQNLRFFIQGNVFVCLKLLQNLCPGCTRSDAASFDLGTQFFILDQLTGILHCQNHRTGCIAFRR